MHNSEQGRARKQRFQERLHVLHDNALHRKLRQHLPAAFNERWTRRHWMHASLFATIGALVATIVPGFSHTIDAPYADSHTSLALPLPPLTMARQQQVPGDSWQVLRIQRGQTLSDLFDKAGIPATTLHRVLEHPGAREALTAAPGRRDRLRHAAVRRPAQHPLRSRRRQPGGTEPGRR